MGRDFTESPVLQVGAPASSELARVGAASWNELFETHWELVARVVRRFGGRSIDVEDAVQEVFLVLFQRLSEFQGKAELTTWLFRICANVASEHRRRQQRRERLSSVARFLTFSSRGPQTPAEAAEARGEWAKVERILAQLPAKRREVFILCELEQLSGEEVAKILDIPTATVRTRLHYARADFARRAEALGGGE